MDKIKFEAGFKALAISLGCKFDKEDEISRLRVYYNILKENGYTDEMWEKSINRMIQTFEPKFGKFYPSTKDFLDMGGMSVSERAKKAHRFPKEEIKNRGYTLPPRFKNKHSHNVAKECIRRLGGWCAVCQDSLMEWDRKLDEFVKLYEELYFGEQSEKPLLGHSDLKNQEFLAEYNKNQIENI